MAAIIRQVASGYHTFVHVWSDERTRDWFMCGSPLVPLAVIFLYLKFVKEWGPKYMENRKPFELKNILLVYNTIQVIFSCVLFYEALAAGWWRHYNFVCQPIDFSYEPKAYRMAVGCWLYYMAKYTELLDTVFFVLRKKQRQVTFLHLYHHSMMIVCGYIGTKFLAGGHGTFLGLINSFVHIIMYAYYLLTALGPQFQKYLWWKRHITRMQMAQFCMVFLHSLLILNRDCNYPKFVVALLAPNSVFFYFLFNDFYMASYESKAKKAKEASEKLKLNGTNGHVEKPIEELKKQS